MIEISDVLDLGKALDALETLHDAQSTESARYCLCGEAAAWRRSVLVLRALHQRLGMRPRLTDEALNVQMGHGRGSA